MGYFLKFPQKLSLPTENVAKIIFVPLLKSLMDLWNLLTPGGTSLPRMRHDIGKIFMGKPRAKKSERPASSIRRQFLSHPNHQIPVVGFEERQVENDDILKFKTPLDIHQNLVQSSKEIAMLPSVWATLKTCINQITRLNHIMKTN